VNLFRIPSAFLTGALMSAMTLPAAADAIADFYSGKQISLIIGYGTGGGYNLYARLLARFIGDHIPGKPTIVAQNMPGAGSRRAANWLYKLAPRDGTVIATLSQTTPIDQVLDQPGIQFDVQRFNWIGNMVVVNNIMFVSAATGVTTIDDAKKKPLAIGSTGASPSRAPNPPASNYAETSSRLPPRRAAIKHGLRHHLILQAADFQRSGRRRQQGAARNIRRCGRRRYMRRRAPVPVYVSTTAGTIVSVMVAPPTIFAADPG
jgi:hypothetical protein